MPIGSEGVAGPATSIGARDGDRTGGVPQAVLLLLGSCLPILGAVLVAPLLPAIARAFADQPGVDVLVPLMIAAPALLIAIVSPFAGAIADRWGRKRILLAGFPLYALIGLAPLFLTSLPAIVASRFALGAAEALIMTICTTLLGDYFRSPVRERMLSAQTIVTAISAVVFVIVGGALGSRDWRTPFWLYGSALLFAPAAALLLWEPLRPAGPAASGGRLPMVPVREAMPWSVLLPLYGLTLFGAIAFYVVPAQAAFLLAGIGVTSPAEAGVVNGVGQFAVLIGAASFNLLRRIGYPRTIALGFVVAAAGLIALGVAGAERSIVAGAVVTGIGVGILLPSFLAATMAQLSLGQRARGTGGFTTAFFLGQFVSPLAILAGERATGSLGWALLGIAAAALLCAPLALLWGHRAGPVSIGAADQADHDIRFEATRPPH